MEALRKGSESTRVQKSMGANGRTRVSTTTYRKPPGVRHFDYRNLDYRNLDYRNLRQSQSFLQKSRTNIREPPGVHGSM